MTYVFVMTAVSLRDVDGLAAGRAIAGCGARRARHVAPRGSAQLLVYDPCVRPPYRAAAAVYLGRAL